MKKMKKILSVLLAILMLTTMVNMDVYAESSLKSSGEIPGFAGSITEEEFMKQGGSDLLTFGSANPTQTDGKYGSQLTGKAATIYNASKKSVKSAKKNKAYVTYTCTRANVQSSANEYAYVAQTAMFAYYWDYLNKMTWATNEISWSGSAKKKGSKYKVSLTFTYKAKHPNIIAQKFSLSWIRL